MATQETQLLDETIVSTRRKMVTTLAGAALAGLAFGAVKAANAATIGDSDILNFALNLEYLEANFYTLATSGMTIDQGGRGHRRGDHRGRHSEHRPQSGRPSHLRCALDDSCHPGLCERDRA